MVSVGNVVQKGQHGMHIVQDVGLNFWQINDIEPLLRLIDLHPETIDMALVPSL